MKLALAVAAFAGATLSTSRVGSAQRGTTYASSFPIEKADLISAGRNPYFILEPGYKLVLAGGAVRLTITVLAETRMVDGVETRVIEERETNAGALVEVSRNYFAIHKRTNDVYYFGEDVDMYANGKVTSHEGAWLSGVNGAHFGLMMPGAPRIGAAYYQEIAPKVAMDRAQIVSLGKRVVVPAGPFSTVLETMETTPLEPGHRETKQYARGVGLIADGEVRLLYPPHWWTPVSHEGAPEWEILPQEARDGEVILSKRNELGLLSNFAATPFTFRGKRYASLEGFWQMMLYPEGPNDARARFPGIVWKHARAHVAQMTAFEAKAAGSLAEDNMKTMGVTWATFEGKEFEYRPARRGQHYDLIVAATWAKVRQNPEVKRVLLATRDLVLKPDHHPEANAPEAWRYTEILTQIRSELQRQRPGTPR